MHLNDIHMHLFQDLPVGEAPCLIRMILQYHINNVKSILEYIHCYNQEKALLSNIIDCARSFESGEFIK